MDASRALLLILGVFALSAARAHMPSHDNILRIQLWDAEGLSREPVATQPPATTTTSTSTRAGARHKLRVDVNSLYDAMLEEAHGGYGRFTRHKVRHKRRRPRQTGADLPWRFHSSGAELMNVAVYDDDVPWDAIEANSAAVNGSAVSDASAGEVNHRDASPPMTLRQPQDEVMSEGKHCSVI